MLSCTLLEAPEVLIGIGLRCSSGRSNHVGITGAAFLPQLGTLFGLSGEVGAGGAGGFESTDFHCSTETARFCFSISNPQETPARSPLGLSWWSGSKFSPRCRFGSEASCTRTVSVVRSPHSCSHAAGPWNSSPRAGLSASLLQTSHFWN